ncbi:hypothetical protein EF847_15545 [Actinobacteria bacterium YIM 96077]|uniref:Uncharacterized protein n=1 Tax=Phytoactinopolyspora halophila TaxID=1981511 RepID=A0A329QTD1_9ACTN|nr:hypothetical protein [Phytoactinopolyspora halophila]AYY13901.1 hypothetical protein EF847_15545 [Actinobacteria bacterium YIM 96077]RAW15557.1 hypothetical protein DPM12_07795 [Phytoactinopolyspora halophila]
MSRLVARVLKMELWRGTAPVAALSIAVAGIATLFNMSEYWAGRWAPLAENLRMILIVLVPLAAAAGAWQGGRERRRRIGELLGSTARSPWQPLLVSWTSVVLGTFVGLAVTWTAGAALVAPVATYEGRHWWWSVVVAFAGLAAASAVGLAVGRLIPNRLVAPILGIVFYVVGGVATYQSGGTQWLMPTVSNSRDGASYLEPQFQLIQITWLLALAAAALVVVGARRRWLSTVPLAVAVVAAIPIATGPGDGRWQPDPQARELVCADGEPQVCLARVNAFVLDDVAPKVREMLERWEGVSGGFERAIDRTSLSRDERRRAMPGNGPQGDEMPDGEQDHASVTEPGVDLERTVVLDLDNLISWNATLARRSEHGKTLELVVAEAAREAYGCEVGAGVPEAAWTAMSVARLWAAGMSDEQPGDGTWVSQEETQAFEHLRSLPEAEQKAWMGDYLAAARDCDHAALTELAGELR